MPISLKIPNLEATERMAVSREQCQKAVSMLKTDAWWGACSLFCPDRHTQLRILCGDWGESGREIAKLELPTRQPNAETPTNDATVCK